MGKIKSLIFLLRVSFFKGLNYCFYNIEGYVYIIFFILLVLKIIVKYPLESTITYFNDNILFITLASIIAFRAGRIIIRIATFKKTHIGFFMENKRDGNKVYISPILGYCIDEYGSINKTKFLLENIADSAKYYKSFDNNQSVEKIIINGLSNFQANELKALIKDDYNSGVRTVEIKTLVQSDKVYSGFAVLTDDLIELYKILRKEKYKDYYRSVIIKLK